MTEIVKNHNFSIFGRRIFAGLMTALFALIVLNTVVIAADGDLDATFGTGGFVKTAFNPNDFDAGWKVVVQPDGKIVTAGIGADPNTFKYVISLARYNADGSLDLTFGNGGKVMSDTVSDIELAIDVALQMDGKIIVVGTTFSGSGTEVAILRFNSDGNTDPSFGSNGKVITNPFNTNGEALGVKVQTDGKIVVGGAVQQVPTIYDFLLMRFDANGNPDPAFGTGGSVRTDFGGNEKAYDIALQADGKIIAVGRSYTIYPDGDFAVARYDTNGNLDAGFGSGGMVLTDINGFDQANSVAVQTDNKIVVAGSASADFAVVRYDANGNLDPAFGTGGKTTTDFFNGRDIANDLAIQPDGKIVLAGKMNPNLLDIETYVDFGIARYDTNGILDSTFGSGGKVSTDFSYIDEARGIAIESNCKIVAAGYAWDVVSGTSDFVLASYESGVNCTVEPPAPTNCPKTHGYWKNHPEEWKVESLTLGGKSYTKAELLALLGNSTQTDASLVLAKQLIAAKLNIANGSDAAVIGSTIAHADSLLSGFGGKLPYKVKSSSVVGQAMVADAIVLDNYNKGLLTLGCGL